MEFFQIGQFQSEQFPFIVLFFYHQNHQFPGVLHDSCSQIFCKIFMKTPKTESFLKNLQDIGLQISENWTSRLVILWEVYNRPLSDSFNMGEYGQSLLARCQRNSHLWNNINFHRGSWWKLSYLARHRLLNTVFLKLKTSLIHSKVLSSVYSFVFSTLSFRIWVIKEFIVEDSSC